MNFWNWRGGGSTTTTAPTTEASTSTSASSLTSSLLFFQHLLDPPPPSNPPHDPPSDSLPSPGHPTTPLPPAPTLSLPPVAAVASLPPPPSPSRSPSSLLSSMPTNTIGPQQLAVKLLPSVPSLAPTISSASPTTPSYLRTPSAVLTSAATAVSTTTSVLISDERIEVDPYDALTAALVPDQLSLTYSTSLTRLWILFLFSLISAMQGATYCTFSTIPDYFNVYFQQPRRDQHLLDLLLNYGPIVYLPTVFLAAYLQSWPQGLRRSLLLAGCFCALGNGLRMIPTFFSTEYREDHLTVILLFIHAGQIINALSAPLVMASPSKLSVTWFGDGERSLATALATVSNGFGIALAYLLFPFVIGDDSQMPLLLRLTFGMAVVPFLLACAYFPDHPASFPSSAAAQRHFNPSLSSLSSQAISFSAGLWRTLLNPSFLSLVLSIGIATGVYAVWSATLPSTLSLTSFSLQQAASFVSVTRFAGIIGGAMAGSLASLPYLARRYKSLLCVFLYLSLILFAVFTLTQPSIGIPSSVLPSDWYLLSFLAVGGAGFFLGASIPLAYELGAELTYPAEESTSAAFITLVMQLASLVLLSITPTLAQVVTSPTKATPTLTINSVMTITAAVAMCLIFPVKEQYRRREAGRAYAHRNQGVAAVLSYYSQLNETVSPSGIAPERTRAWSTGEQKEGQRGEVSKGRKGWFRGPQRLKVKRTENSHI